MKAGLFVTLSESYQTFVNGLAGNYDGSAKREFTSSVGGIETDVCIWSSSFQLDQFCKVKCPIKPMVKIDGSLTKVTELMRRKAVYFALGPSSFKSYILDSKIILHFLIE